VEAPPGSGSAVDYDQVAPTYDQRYAALTYHGVASTLLPLVRAASTDRILEVGCGTGHWIAELGTACAQVYGLDLSLGMLGQAPRDLHGRLVCGEAGHLPFCNASFDLMICVNALHHFAARRRFLFQAREALRSGGRLAVIGLDPHAGTDDWYLYHYFEGTRQADLARYPSADLIERWMTESGFVDVTSGIAERMAYSLHGSEVFRSPFLQKSGTSQLALLTEEAYAAGLERIKADLEQAQRAGVDLEFVVDISFALVLGEVP
jgi:ubiquinone/menaquinone biosynthesis C-methylase UbiE